MSSSDFFSSSPIIVRNSLISSDIIFLRPWTSFFLRSSYAALYASVGVASDVFVDSAAGSTDSPSTGLGSSFVTVFAVVVLAELTFDVVQYALWQPEPIAASTIMITKIRKV